MDFKQIITGIYDEVKASAPDGKVSDYIPELAKVEPDKFGIALITTKGSTFSIGDVEEKFSIQSIAKVFLLSLAFSIRGRFPLGEGKCGAVGQPVQFCGSIGI